MHVKLFLVLFNFAFVLSAEPNDVSLELLQVLFRHGARYPDEKELSLAGSDEYSAMFNSADSLGQLLTVGKRQEYELGKKLRARYDQFLGEFKYAEVYARSTNYDRTKMSLQLVLAGLYPPTANTSWSDTIRWSPIPTIYEPEKQIDFLDVTYESVCMKNGELVNQVINTPDIKNKMGKYQELAKKLERHTGVNKWIPTSGYGLYGYLTSVTSMNLSLPSWCTPEDLAQLREVASISMDTLVYTPQMRRIMAGMMIEELLKNIDNKENNKRKVFLYSAHDTNIGPFVRVHNFTGIPTFPDFGSAVIIEKLKSGDGQLYIRMFYWTGATGQLIPVKLKDFDNICLTNMDGGASVFVTHSHEREEEDNICLLSNYRSAVAPLLPNQSEKDCFSQKALCKE